MRDKPIEVGVWSVVTVPVELHTTDGVQYGPEIWKIELETGLENQIALGVKELKLQIVTWEESRMVHREALQKARRGRVVWLREFSNWPASFADQVEKSMGLRAPESSPKWPSKTASTKGLASPNQLDYR